jgi:hypothetical protein
MKLFPLFNSWLLLTGMSFSEETDQQKYDGLLTKLFKDAKEIRIKGRFGWKDGIHEANFKTSKAPDIRNLEKAFRKEKPTYVGLVPAHMQPSMYASYFYVYWFDKDTKPLGRLVHINGDTLIFDDKHMFEIPKINGGNNITLLIEVARIGIPGILPRSK